jgi:TRAP-type C4-dicarboxylate transport system permease small subunit
MRLCANGVQTHLRAKFESKGKIMKKLLNGVTTIFDVVYRVLCEYSKLVLIVIVLVVSAQVFCRKFLGFSLFWSDEIALLLMVWMAFISMPIGVEKNLHIVITMFFDLFPKTVQKVITKITNVLLISFGVVMVVYGSILIEFTASSTLPSTKLPASTLYLMIPVSGVFIIYYSIIDLFNLQKFKHANIIGHQSE